VGSLLPLSLFFFHCAHSKAVIFFVYPHAVAAAAACPRGIFLPFILRALSSQKSARGEYAMCIRFEDAGKKQKSGHPPARPLSQRSITAHKKLLPRRLLLYGMRQALTTNLNAKQSI
jgi:hypothetical protein